MKIWNAATGDVEQTLAGHSSFVWSVAFSPDGSKIVSGSEDNTVKIWNAATGDVEQTLAGHSSWKVFPHKWLVIGRGWLQGRAHSFAEI